MRTFLVLLLAAVAQCYLAPVLKVTPSIPGQYIIVLEDNIDVSTFAGSLSEGTVKNTIKGIINAVTLKVESDGLERIRVLPGIKYIEEDGVAQVLRSAPTWGIDRIDQRNLPLDGDINIGNNGAGSNVYIIDTGIRYTHEQFNGRAKPFFDYEGGDGSDCHSHGTHCAGTAVGKEYGVASEANVFSVRVMSCGGSGAYSDIINGLNAVAGDSRSDKVASMSIGGGVSNTLNDAVASAHAAGTVVVTSAGNSNFLACRYSPASAPDAITVGATTSSDARAYYSNYGTCVDIFAPGSNVVSAYFTSDDAYTSMSGTSMSCPHVAGAAAVLLSSGVSHANIDGTLKSDATANVVTDPGTGSPNLLLYLE